jgi:hypothetical protein
VVAGLAGRIGLGVGAERAEGGVKGAEPGQPQLFPGMAGCPCGLRHVGVADQPQPPVGHGPDVGLAGQAEDREGFVPDGPLVRCFLAGLGTERVIWMVVAVHFPVRGDAGGFVFPAAAGSGVGGYRT